MERDLQPSVRACDPLWVRNLALRAGAELQAASLRRGALRVDHKGRVDLVTETDLVVQGMLVEEIRGEFPDDRIVAEEGDLARRDSTAGAVWYLDPLDGTTNFVHGYPFFCVSIARWIDGEPAVGAVYAPALDELYVAVRDGGAAVERPRSGEPARALHARDCASLDDALLATGFPYDRGRTATLNLAICARALTRARGLRRGGSAALDLCHVADARLDGYWEMGLAPWDLAAAVLVAREAGILVTDFAGDADVLEARRLVAAGPGLHPQLRGMIVDVHRDPDLEVLGRLEPGEVPLTGPLPGDRP